MEKLPMEVNFFVFWGEKLGTEDACGKAFGAKKGTRREADAS